MNLRHPVIVGLAIVAGIALIVLAIVYWAEPAKSLPSFVPGHAIVSEWPNAFPSYERSVRIQNSFVLPNMPMTSLTALATASL